MDRHLKKQYKKLLTKQTNKPRDSILQAHLYAQYVLDHGIITTHVFDTHIINGRQCKSIKDATATFKRVMPKHISIQTVSVIDYV